MIESGAPAPRYFGIAQETIGARLDARLEPWTRR